MNQSKLIESLIMALIEIRETSHNTTDLRELQTDVEQITDAVFGLIAGVDVSGVNSMGR